MISFSDNPIFFTSMFVGVFGFCFAALWAIYSLEKGHKKKPTKHKKA